MRERLNRVGFLAVSCIYVAAIGFALVATVGNLIGLASRTAAAGQPVAVPPAYSIGANATAQAVNATARTLAGRVEAAERAAAEAQQQAAAALSRVQALEAAVGVGGGDGSGDGPGTIPPGEIPGSPPVAGAFTPPPIFQAKCVRCHTGANASGGVDFTNAEDYRTWVADSVVLAWVGMMPKNAPPLTDAETDQMVAAWKAARGKK